jgi:hypothetical protein
MPHWLYLLPFFYLLIRNKKMNTFNTKKQKNSFYILTSIVMISLVNFLFGLDKIKSLQEFAPYIIFYFITFFIASNLKEKDMKILIYFVFVEVVFIFIEFALGIDTIYLHQEGARSGLSYVYLYYFRPHGLSSGSSTVAYKIFLGILLIDYLRLTKNKFYIILKWLFIAASIIVFNRTVLIALFIYYIMKNAKHIFRYIYIYIPILLFVLSIIYPTLYSQFNRGHNSIDLSYRDVIWADNFNFIKENILLGNNAHKYYVLLPEYNEYEHAHNSFIETLSSNGIIIFILYLFFILYNLTKTNYIYIIPILIYSSYQYGIFWGISYMDIVFMYLLVFNNRHFVQLKKLTYSRDK